MKARSATTLWIALGAAAVAMGLGPRLLQWAHRCRLSWMTPDERLERAVSTSMGTVLARGRSEHISMAVGTPPDATLEGVYMLAYRAERVEPTEGISFSAHDADPDGECACAVAFLGITAMPQVARCPVSTLPPDEQRDLEERLRGAIDGWRIPWPGEGVDVQALLLPRARRVTFKVSRCADTRIGNTTTSGPEVETVEVVVDAPR